nr:MAPK-interacting and spindle-stabilizing protein-like [Aegilops tauschii subsp. strangulata]
MPVKLPPSCCAAGTPSAPPPPVRVAPPPHHTDDNEATPGTGPLGPRWGPQGPDLGRGRAAGQPAPPRRLAAKGPHHPLACRRDAGPSSSRGAPPLPPCPGQGATRVGTGRPRRHQHHPAKPGGGRGADQSAEDTRMAQEAAACIAGPSCGSRLRLRPGAGSSGLLSSVHEALLVWSADQGWIDRDVN